MGHVFVGFVRGVAVSMHDPHESTLKSIVHAKMVLAIMGTVILISLEEQCPRVRNEFLFWRS